MLVHQFRGQGLRSFDAGLPGREKRRRLLELGYASAVSARLDFGGRGDGAADVGFAALVAAAVHGRVVARLKAIGFAGVGFSFRSAAGVAWKNVVFFWGERRGFRDGEVQRGEAIRCLLTGQT